MKCVYRWKIVKLDLHCFYCFYLDYFPTLLPAQAVRLESFAIYRSKGLPVHLMKRKHYTAAKYIDFLSDIIEKPDYAGIYNGSIELVKCYKDNIFVSIKIDVKRKHYYVATMFAVKKSKIDSYVKSGRLKIVNKLL